MQIVKKTAKQNKLKDSIDVILFLRDLYPDIKEFKFGTYVRIPHSKERIKKTKDLGEFFRENKDGRIFSIKTRVLSREYLLNYLNRLPDNTALKIYSFVKDKNKMKHLPLLDLLNETDHSFSPVAIKKIFSHKIFGQPHGFLFDSGNDFHFIGTDLIKRDKFLQFVGNSLLAANIIDKRYIAHHLKQNCLTLRIATKLKNKSFQIPKVILIW